MNIINRILNKYLNFNFVFSPVFEKFWTNKSTTIFLEQSELNIYEMIFLSLNKVKVNPCPDPRDFFPL